MTTPGKTSKTTPTAEKPLSAKQAVKARKEAQRRRQQQQQQILLVIGAVALLAFVAIAIFVSSRPVEAVVPTEAVGRYTELAQKNWKGRTPEGFYFLGAENAPAVIEEFASFSCPACQSFHEQDYAGLQDKIKAGHLKFVYVPLTTYGGFESSGAAKAALCAGEQGKFFEMHDILFDWLIRYGTGINDGRRASAAAVVLGLDTSKYDACLNSGDVQRVLDKAAEVAATRGVAATPTIFLDGQQIRPALPGKNAAGLGEIRGLIEAKVAAQGGK
jgi:protein-disulfide isomerase